MASLDAVKKVIDNLKDKVDLQDPKHQAVAAVAGAAVAYRAFKLLKGAPRVVQNGKYKNVPLPADAYDALIVGGGPSGSTCGYFFAKARGPSGRPCLESAQCYLRIVRFMGPRQDVGAATICCQPVWARC